MSDEQLEPHPLLEDVDQDDQLLATIDGEWMVLAVDEVKHRPTEDGGFVMVHSIDERSRWWDLTSTFTPQEGWSGFEAARRYQVGNETHWTDEVVVDELRRADLGVDPSRLEPGQDFDYYDGERYRVVVTPAERDYDEKVLAYCLSDGSNVTKKLDPGRILRPGGTGD